MKLKKIFSKSKLPPGLARLDISGISQDTRQAKSGDLFFVRKREGFDIFALLSGIDGIPAVFAVDIADRKKIEGKINKTPVIYLKDFHRNFCLAADNFYGFDPKDFIFIGITGTKGKTTTAYLIYEFLKKRGEKCALIGTIKYHVGSKTYKAPNTTPDYLSLRKIFKEAKEEKVRYVIMEVSSHSIEQNRIEGLHFFLCLFTNLTREHLDYHKTMSIYFKAKEKLFIGNPGSTAVLNVDDHYGKNIFRRHIKKISFAINNKADFSANNIKLGTKETIFDITHKDQSVKIKTRLLGRHNVLNVLGGATALSGLGFGLKEFSKFIPNFRPVEGRLEQVYPGIFVDYAHTHDSLRKALEALRDIGYEKIICVFGCGGNRDKGKRPLMGKIASTMADFSLVTSDNPRHEDALTICRQIEKGFDKKNYALVVDRKQAIERGVSLQSHHDKCCLLVAGKGHEDCQIIGDEHLPFKDKDVILSALKNLPAEVLKV
jgi:UDP-N-acetylmuramoyl-L-alanyl-D-glutamate--2,6-diaminopimelate ligase